MAVGPDFMAFTRGAEDAIKANQRDEDRWIKMQDDEVKRQNAIIDRQYAERDQAYKEQVQSLGLDTLEDTRATRAANRISADMQNTIIAGVKTGRFSSPTEAFVVLQGTKVSDDPIVQSIFDRNMNTYASSVLLKGALETGNLKDLSLLQKAGYGSEDVLNSRAAIADPAKMDEELLRSGFKPGATPGTYQSAAGDISAMDAFRLKSSPQNATAIFQDIVTRRANAERSTAELNRTTTDTATKAASAYKTQVQDLASKGIDPATILDPALRADVTEALAEIASRRGTPATGASTLSPMDEATRQRSGMRIPLPAGITPSMGRGNTGNPGFVSALPTPAMPSQPRFVAPAQQTSTPSAALPPQESLKSVQSKISELTNLQREFQRNGSLTPEMQVKFTQELARMRGLRNNLELEADPTTAGMRAAAQTAAQKAASEKATKEAKEAELYRRFNGVLGR